MTTVTIRRYLLPAAVVAGVVAFGFATAGGATAARNAGGSAGRSGASGAGTHGIPLAQGSGGTGSSPCAGPVGQGPSINPQCELPASQSFLGANFNYPSEKLPASDVAPGQVLFDENCSSCHGLHADGATGLAPPLLGLGPATIDFWVSTGRMPLAQSTVQPNVHPNKFTRKETEEIVAYVASLTPGEGAGIPLVNTKAGNLAQGANLYAMNCAGCHVITAVGDALANSTFAPALSLANRRIIGDAVRSGPGNMPRFTTLEISPSQLDSLARYVVYLSKHPDDAGGAGLGHVGPVAEGFVALFFGVGLLVLVAYWIGDRTPDPRENEDEPDDQSINRDKVMA